MCCLLPGRHAGLPDRCARSPRSRWRNHALAEYRPHCCADEGFSHKRWHASQTGRMPRGPVARREAREDSARYGSGFTAGYLQFPRDIWNRSDGGMKGETVMKLESIRAAEAKLLLSTYERNPILFVGGEGVYLQDEAGEKYLDLLSGIGVNALGYNHPAIVNAIAEQSRKLIHTSNLFFHEGQAELALRLTEMTGLDRVFFCNSGTEAWEAAMKVARAYAGLRRSEGHAIGTRFLALENSFHGRTFGSVSTTHKEKYREPFAPVVPGVEFVRFNDVEDLKTKFSNDVCAVMIEAIQGEGGVRPLS